MAENPYHEAVVLAPDGRRYFGRLLQTRTAPASPAATPETPAPAPAPAAPPVPRSDWTARLVAILDLPEARQRQRQALAWALESNVSPDAARKMLTTVPTDDAAKIAHGYVLLPTGAPPLPPDAARIATILRSQEAEGREAQARVLAVEGVPAAQARQLLAAMPVRTTVRIPTIAERAAAEAEFGGEFEEMTGGTAAARRKTRVDAMWKKATDKANAGVTTAAPAAPAVTRDKQG